MLVAVALSAKAGPFRFLAGAAIVLAGAYWLHNPIGWTPMVLAVIGVLFVGFVDAVRAKK